MVRFTWNFWSTKWPVREEEGVCSGAKGLLWWSIFGSLSWQFFLGYTLLKSFLGVDFWTHIMGILWGHENAPKLNHRRCPHNWVPHSRTPRIGPKKLTLKRAPKTDPKEGPFCRPPKVDPFVEFYLLILLITKQKTPLLKKII